MLLNTRRVIGTVCYLGGVPAVLEEFCWAWSQLIQYNAEYVCGPTEQIYYTRAKVSDHAFARNVLAAQMQGDWILYLDTDHQFEPDLLARLLREFHTNDLDVLVGAYVYRQPPYAPVLYLRDPETKALKHLGAWESRDDGRPYLMPIASAGGGCLLVRRRVFERIEHELHEPPFQHRGAFSEDHSFFDRLKDIGIQSYCCPLIENPHLTTRALTLADFDASQVSIGPRVEVVA